MRLVLAWLAAVALLRFHVAPKGRYVETLRPENIVLLKGERLARH